ncbi:hypothetical protein ACGH52_38165 [Streptomyces sp. BBFR25]|uniref:hypothetical protein n=1 Tax=unclassified Streptomyces TaxID=2593676 RepID=UPI0035A8430E
MLTAAACAVLSGAASTTAIGEWVADAPQRVLTLRGFLPDPLTGLIRPRHATTIRLVLAAAEGDALGQTIGHFLREPVSPWRNPPALHQSVRRLPWHDVRLAHYVRGRAHHETRADV